MKAHAEHATAWIYQGIWAVMSGWFKVPRHPPELPTDGGEPTRSFHPSLQFLKYLKLYFWILLIIIDAALLVLWGLLFVFQPTIGVLITPAALALIIVPDVIAYIAIHLRYDTTWYVMSDRSLRCRRGIWLICEHTVTFENVQDVNVRRGPVQQLFGISTIVVETAGASEDDTDNHFAVGNKAIMEGIANPDEIRELIMERVRRSKQAGLGDEPAAPTTPNVPDEITLLREIRDEAAAIVV